MNIKTKNLFSPLSLPILFFLSAILAGTILLHCQFSYLGSSITWLDSLFTATSATCVTGLTVVDTGSAFSQTGQTIIIILIQLGGLGIMTFTSLAFYLLKNRVSLTDRIAVGQSLLHDSSFHLGKFLIQIIVVTFTIELFGALFLFCLDSLNFSFFSAIFHSISAFCNAGFSLNPDSLILLRGNWPINLTIMLLIILGGLGFSVIVEGKSHLLSLVKGKDRAKRMSWHFIIVVQTSLFLIIVGWLYIYFSEFISFKKYLPFHEAVLTSLFQSVTCRTAGFNTLDIGSMTNVSLIFMMILMLIGGAPGSCAGGIKVTTF
ncbi:MAG: ATPase, partial [Desulfobulbaceae bacterium]|nr:ATPase [Desulfobulbaceae bacterium]